MRTRSILRLAWHNPDPRAAGPRPRAEGTGAPLPMDLAPAAAAPMLKLLPPVPRRTVALALAGRRVNLATAIEAHLAGDDGLSEQDFVALFAGGGRRT